MAYQSPRREVEAADCELEAARNRPSSFVVQRTTITMMRYHASEATRILENADETFVSKSCHGFQEAAALETS